MPTFFIFYKVVSFILSQLIQRRCGLLCELVSCDSGAQLRSILLGLVFRPAPERCLSQESDFCPAAAFGCRQSQGAETVDSHTVAFSGSCAVTESEARYLCVKNVALGHG